MSQFISRENVFTNRKPIGRFEAIREISEIAVNLGISNGVDDVYGAFVWREEQCETGLEDGFAIPHAKSNDINHAAVIVYKMDSPIEWPSFDGKPVDICIALLVPGAEAGTTHLKLLSNTAVLLMDEEVRDFLRSSDDSEAIAQLISDRVATFDVDDGDEDDEE